MVLEGKDSYCIIEMIDFVPKLRDATFAIIFLANILLGLIVLEDAQEESLKLFHIQRGYEESQSLECQTQLCNNGQQ